MSLRVFATFVFLLSSLAGAQVTREALVQLANELERLPETSSLEDAAPYFADLPVYGTKTSSAKLVPTAFLTTGLSVERGVPVVLLVNTLELMMRSSRLVETGFGESSDASVTFPAEKECRVYEALVWGKTYGVSAASLKTLSELLEKNLVSKDFTVARVEAYEKFVAGAAIFATELRKQFVTTLLEQSDVSLDDLKADLNEVLSEDPDSVFIPRVAAARTKEELNDVLQQMLEADAEETTLKAFTAQKGDTQIAGLWTGEAPDEPGDLALVWCVLGAR